MLQVEIAAPEPKVIAAQKAGAEIDIGALG
jgi:hypothetical protein